MVKEQGEVPLLVILNGFDRQKDHAPPLEIQQGVVWV